MKKIELKGLDKTISYEKLDNGLEIFLIPYSDKNNYYMSYITNFGSEINTFIPYGEKKYKTVSNGIAHFLEHKMFEQEDGIDPFKFFSESGTGANAFTSFDRTQYICYGTKEFDKNLRYLLKYVNQPYFTDENVQKEKGIIKEEIKMYEDIPEWVLETKLRESIYLNHPRKLDIAGSCDDVDGITKEELYTCYNTFYQPNNMFIVVAGKFDEDKTINIIKEELSNKENKNTKIKVKESKEVNEVCREEYELSMNLKVPKVAIGYKMDKSKFKIKDKLELDLYLNMLTTLLFGSSSLFRERVRSKHLMTGFYSEWDSTSEFESLFIFSETENPELLVGEIEEELKNIDISKDDIERMKKVWIANEVKMIDSIETTVSNVIDDNIRYSRIVDDKVSLIRKMNKQRLDQLVKTLDFTNRSKVILLPNKIITKEQ